MTRLSDTDPLALAAFYWTAGWAPDAETPEDAAAMLPVDERAAWWRACRWAMRVTERYREMFGHEIMEIVAGG